MTSDGSWRELRGRLIDAAVVAELGEPGVFALGAEFTKVYANRYGSRILPDHNALPLTHEAREQQGIPADKQAGKKGDRPTPPPGPMPRF